MSRLAVLALGLGLCFGLPRMAQADDAPGDQPGPADKPALRDEPAPADKPALRDEPAPADKPALAAGDDGWRYRSTGAVTIDSGVVIGFPAALPTGLSTGIGAGVSRGQTFAIGARAAWVTATESSLPWTVTHSDLRLRLTGAVQATPGRGVIGLRLGLGGTLVHETRIRNQGMRAGLTGSDLEDSAFAMLPAADLDAVVALHIAGPWLLVTSGGPSFDILDGKLHAGWSAELGVAWQP